MCFDVFIKIAGGLRIDDPGIDLSIASAIYSSLVNQPLKVKSVYIGEIGLNGDVRPVNQIHRPIDEALKLGFTSIYLPQIDGFHSKRTGKKEIHYLKNISELIINQKPQPEGQIL